MCWITSGYTAFILSGIPDVALGGNFTLSVTALNDLGIVDSTQNRLIFLNITSLSSPSSPVVVFAATGLSVASVRLVGGVALEMLLAINVGSAIVSITKLVPQFISDDISEVHVIRVSQCPEGYGAYTNEYPSGPSSSPSSSTVATTSAPQSLASTTSTASTISLRTSSLFSSTASSTTTTNSPTTLVASSHLSNSCQPCIPGTFSSFPTNGPCRNVSDCPPGTYVLLDATSSADRVCSPCPPSTFQNNKNTYTCTHWNNCSAGQYITAIGTPTSDFACQACTMGTYQTFPNAAECLPWTVCAAGFAPLLQPTSTSDRQCTSCLSGTFSLGNNTACTPWSVCGAGLQEALPPSVTSDRVCHSCVLGSNFNNGSFSHCVPVKGNCTPGHFIVSPATLTSDFVCGSCFPPFQYQDTGGQTACKSTHFCSWGQYEATSPTASSDTICIPIMTPSLSLPISILFADNQTFGVRSRDNCNGWLYFYICIYLSFNDEPKMKLTSLCMYVRICVAQIW